MSAVNGAPASVLWEEEDGATMASHLELKLHIALRGPTAESTEAKLSLLVAGRADSGFCIEVQNLPMHLNCGSGSTPFGVLVKTKTSPLLPEVTVIKRP
jgi:hypothetical protein